MMTSYDKSHESKSIILLHGIKFLIVSLPIGFCISVFIVLILRLFGIDMNNKLSALSSQQRIQLYPWAGLFAFGVVAPLLEETLFRLWLSLRRWHIGISVFVIAYVAITLITTTHLEGKGYGFFPKAYAVGWYYKLLIASFVAIGIWFISTSKLEQIKQRFALSLAMISNICFACMHVGNYYSYPLLVLPFVALMCLP